MEATIYEQTLFFILSIISGGIIGIIYDFIKVFGKIFFPSDKLNNFLDIFFILSAFSFLFLFFFNLNGFDIRIYHIFGCIFGVFLYFLSISSFTSKILYVFFNFFKKILKILLYPIKILCKIVNRVIMFILWILDSVDMFIKKHITKHITTLKKIFKRRKKI